MQRVHDLTGDWFAMPPMGCARSEVEEVGGVWPIPDVGDVLASTRTCTRTGYTIKPGDHGNANGVFGQSVCPDCSGTGVVWADPPFVRVVEVLPVHGLDDALHDDKPSVEIRPDGATHYYSQLWVSSSMDDLVDQGLADGEQIDLPGAQPGGWAVRLTNVEALSGHVDSAVTPEEAQALRVESINERHARLQGETSWDA